MLAVSVGSFYVIEGKRAILVSVFVFLTSNAMDSDDDVPQLSEATLAALRAFAEEKEQNERRFEALQKAAEKNFEINVGIDVFGEDYQLRYR